MKKINIGIILSIIWTMIGTVVSSLMHHQSNLNAMDYAILVLIPLSIGWVGAFLISPRKKVIKMYIQSKHLLISVILSTLIIGTLLAFLTTIPTVDILKAIPFIAFFIFWLLASAYDFLHSVNYNAKLAIKKTIKFIFSAAAIFTVLSIGIKLLDSGIVGTIFALIAGLFAFIVDALRNPFVLTCIVIICAIQNAKKAIINAIRENCYK